MTVIDSLTDELMNESVYVQDLLWQILPVGTEHENAETIYALRQIVLENVRNVLGPWVSLCELATHLGKDAIDEEVEGEILDQAAQQVAHRRVKEMAEQDHALFGALVAEVLDAPTKASMTVGEALQDIVYERLVGKLRGNRP